MDKKLEEYKRVYAEINLDAILGNVENMKANIEKDTSIMAVIKTDAYGHGSEVIAEILEKVDYIAGFAVATPEEAFMLRKAGIKKTILILGYSFPYCFDDLIENDICPAVFTEDSVEKMGKAAVKLGKKAVVHIKVDTGMGRIGISPDLEGMKFIEKVLHTEGIEVQGIFTHFARADEADKTDAYRQMNVFKEFVDNVERTYGIKIPIKHCSNSAAIIEMKEANMDMVRAGIILYGLYPSEEVSKNKVVLTPALSLYSHITFIKQINPGQSISYGGTFTADRRMKVATVPVGYGDGYPRALSNCGYVLIRGRKAPILGRVCMDQFMVDVTEIPGVSPADRVTLLGSDGGECITAEELGDLSGRFNYELVCDFGKRIPRVFRLHGQIIACRDMLY